MASPDTAGDLLPAGRGAAPPVPAGFLRRSLAAAIDAAVLIAFLFADYYLLVAGLGWQVDRVSAGPVDYVFILTAAVFAWLYCAGAESSGRGRTLGKALLRLAVRDRDGEVPGLGRASLRFVARFATLATALVGWFAILVTKRRQALHDLIAGTVVVVDDRAPV